MFFYIFIFALAIGLMVWKSRQNLQSKLSLKCDGCSGLNEVSLIELKGGNRILCENCSHGIDYEIVNIDGYSGGREAVRVKTTGVLHVLPRSLFSLK